MYINDEDIMSYFPLDEPRAGQVAVLREIDKVLKTGKKFIILEGPVGCGKSAIAMTLAKAFGDAHVITPLRSLQNQYFEDFSEDIVLMKGRSSYPCILGRKQIYIKKVIDEVKNGNIKQPGLGEENCGNAPCRGNLEVFKACSNSHGPCPYTVAIETAQKHSCVIHNLHSFIFQTAFTEKFDQRKVMIIDEAHEIEKTIRGFISKKIHVNKPIKEDERPENIYDIDSWCNFFLQDQYLPVLTPGEKQLAEKDPAFITPLTEYRNRIESFRLTKDYYGNKFSVKATINVMASTNREMSTTFEFVPDSLGGTPSRLLFDFGEHVILMSGTIFDKSVFCNNLGISQESAHFIRIPSTFPVSNRPIYLKPEFQVDTSFVKWNENFEEMIEKIKKIMSIFDDAKGLIHAPSYDAAEQIARALPGTRTITHSPSDFQSKLKEFFDSEGNGVFISPVCQQGVDFKEDRARFQIIVRIPYLNTSDEFVKYKVENDFSWYNYQALVIFGQMLGRVNRSEKDYGATFILDSRFNRFITKNLRVIPKWVQQAMVWK